jgi:hypothetical protein
MTSILRNKAFIGIGRFMLPLPQALVRRDIHHTATAICRKTVDINEEERMVHRFVVTAITDTKQPVTPELIARELEMPLDRVHEIVDRLESLKVFFYRYNNIGINWAYPVTAEDQLYRMSFETGKTFYAA